MGAFILASVYCLLTSAFAQQPQTSTAPLFSANAKYVQGVGPGYWPTAGSGLTLNLSAGTAFCGNPPAIVTYGGGTLTMTDATTNYIYLNPAANCAPGQNTAGFSSGHIPLARVVTAGGAITSIADARNWFTPLPCSMSSAGALSCAASGTNQDIELKPSGTGKLVMSTSGGTIADFTGADDGSGFTSMVLHAVGAGVQPQLGFHNSTSDKWYGTIEADDANDGLYFYGGNHATVSANTNTTITTNWGSGNIYLLPGAGLAAGSGKIIIGGPAKVTTADTNQDLTIAPNGTGQVLVTRVNNVRFADQFPGADAGAKIAACIADLPATGGTCDARGLEGAQIISTDPFAGATSAGKLLLGQATFTVEATINPKSWWIIEGSGRGTSLRAGASLGANPIIKWSGVNGVALRNLRLDGNDTVSVGMEILNYTQRSPLVENVWFEKFDGTHVLRINAAWEVVFVGGGIFNCQGAATVGLLLEEAANLNTFLGFSIVGVKGVGVRQTGGSRNTFINPDIAGSPGLPMDLAVDLQGGTHTILQNMWIEQITGVDVTPSTPAVIISGGNRHRILDGVVAGNLNVTGGTGHIIDAPLMSRNGSRIDVTGATDVRIRRAKGTGDYSSIGYQTTALIGEEYSGLEFAFSSPGTNLLSNPGFDRFTSGLANGWSKTSAPSVTTTEETTEVETGANSQKVVTTATAHGIQQAVTVVNGLNYTVVARVKAGAAGGAEGICIASKAGGTGAGAYVKTSSTSWTTIYTVLRATATSMTVAVTAETTAGAFYVDRIWMVPGKVPVAPAQAKTVLRSVDVDTALATGVNIVPYSATPTFDASLGNTQKITLTGNVTSSTLANAAAGQWLHFIICQDATGDRTFTWPSNVKGGMTIGSNANTCSAQSFVFDAANAYALSPGVQNM